ncbi:MAG TPA: autotransporter domain-containing protein [Rhizomicrobium sp.]
MAGSAGLCIALALQEPAVAGPDIGTGSTVKSSSLGSSDTPAFKGGTLQLDTANPIANNFVVEDDATNTIDEAGHSVTMSGVFSGAGPLTITDSAGGGNVTLSNSANTYTGSTTINSGATLSLAAAGTIAGSTELVDNGTFSIAATSSGASITSLSGSGAVALGAQTLTITDGVDTFTGTVSGTGDLTVSGGTQILAGTNTYTGGTTISGGTLQIGNAAAAGSIVGNVADAGTLAFDRTDNIVFGGTITGTGNLTQLGTGRVTLTAVNSYSGTTTITSGTLALAAGASIAASAVNAAGTLDISATAGASIRSLAGTGAVDLGAATLTITAGATDTFSGVIAGTGGITLDGGTEALSGANTYTGATIVNAGTLELGSAAIANNVTDNGTVGFNAANSATIQMTGVISGSGSVEQIDGTTTITAAQTYTGSTTISGGTLVLSGNGSIASSSGVEDDGSLQLATTTADASLTSLAGSGTVLLGPTNLTISNGSGNFSGVMSGSGGLTLLGGKETLSGVNTFTGVTTISGGTLLLANPNSVATSSIVDNATLDISQITAVEGATTSSTLSLSGSGTVVLGGNTLVLTSAADTFSGTISGTGGLSVSGGKEILTGANTYTGPTTISGGTLALAGAGSLSTADTVDASGVFDVSAVTAGPTVKLASLSGTGTVVLGSENLELADADTTFSGAISGSGGLIVAGGTEILSGANSYTGGTAITAGTLQIGNGFASGSIVGDVSDQGVLAFDRANALVFAGKISGTGEVLQSGSGTTILTGDNTYTGGTTIALGTLQIGNGAAAGSIAGNVADDGTLAFGRSDTTTFSGTISGTGGVAQVSGTTVLTAIESYSGTTAINSLAGLTLTGAGSIAGSSDVIDNGVFDVSTTTTAPQIASLGGAGMVTLGGQTLTVTNGTDNFSGTISGTGGYAQAGGTETLSGIDAYTGGTVVNGGILSVNGSIASSSGVAVNSGGTLAGSGTVPGVVLANGGAIAPGSLGTGTLSVNGSVAFASGSKFIVDIDNGSAGKLSTTGAEALAGTLSIESADGSYPLGQKLTVLTAAGGVSGTFTLSPIASTGAQFSSKLSYDAHDVFLEIDLAKLSPLLPAGSTVNETAPVAGIDAAIAAGNTVPSQIQNLGTLTPAALQSDAAQLAGEVASDAAQAGTSLFNPFLTTIFDHIADEQPVGSHGRMPQGNQVWAAGLIGSELMKGDPDTTGSHRFRSNVDGIVAGGEWSVSPNMLLGVAASVGASNYHLADGFGQGKVTAYQLGVYGLMQFSRHFYGAFVGALSLDDVATTRMLTVSGSDALAGKFDGRVLGGRYETGAELGWFTPYLALQDALFDAPSYKETAAAGSGTFGLSYAGRTTNTADFEFGLRQRGDLDLEGWTLKLSDRLAWLHDMSATPTARAAFTAMPDSDFTTYGVRPGKNALLLSLGAGLDSSEGFGLDVHFDSAISSRSQTYTEFADVKFAW